MSDLAKFAYKAHATPGLKTDRLPTGSVEASFNGLKVLIREKDGFINASRLCKDGSKLFADWKRLESSSAFLEALSTSMGNPIDLVQTISGGENHERGTWVHPQVAINIAQWISPQYAVFVSDIVLRHHKGDLTLAADTLKNHDMIQGTTSTMTIQTELGKRRREELELEDLEASIAEKRARTSHLQYDVLTRFYEFLEPGPDASEVDKIRAKSDQQTVRSYMIRAIAPSSQAAVSMLEGDEHGPEISFALVEQQMGVRLTSEERKKAGSLAGRMWRDKNPGKLMVKRTEVVNGAPMAVNAYWERDRPVLVSAIQKVLKERR